MTPPDSNAPPTLTMDQIRAANAAPAAPVNPVDLEAIAELTKYHAATPQQIELMAVVRASTAQLIHAIMLCCPKNADRSAAVRKAREALMTANASIVLPPGIV